MISVTTFLEQHGMTQHYVGTKIVEAWGQVRDGAPGYAVKYADGYISWSPQAAFEAAYLPLGHIGHLPPHVQRMYAERVELEQRLDKLNAFLDSEQFAALSVEDRSLLDAQARAMRQYCNVLNTRVSIALDAAHQALGVTLL